MDEKRKEERKIAEEEDPLLKEFKSIRQEIGTYQERLDLVKKHKEKVREKVFKKVKSEYTSKLTELLKQIKPHKLKLEEAIQAKDQEKVKLNTELELKIEDQEELELRHLAGEFSNEDFGPRKEDIKSQVEKIKSRIAGMDAVIKLYQENISSVEPLEKEMGVDLSADIEQAVENLTEGLEETEEEEEEEEEELEEESAEYEVSGARDVGKQQKSSRSDVAAIEELVESEQEEEAAEKAEEEHEEASEVEAVEEDESLSDFELDDEDFEEYLEDLDDDSFDDESPTIRRDLSEDLEESLEEEEEQKKAAGPIPILEIIEGEHKGQSYPITTPLVKIGRGMDNDIQLSEDTSVSRHHAQVVYKSHQYALIDVDSSNGSFINGVRVKEQVLKPGDDIMIGQSRLIFKIPDMEN